MVCQHAESLAVCIIKEKLQNGGLVLIFIIICHKSGGELCISVKIF